MDKYYKCLRHIAYTGILTDKLESVKNNEFKIQDRLVLSAKISGNEESYYAVNDFVVQNETSYRVTSLSLFIDNQHVSEGDRPTSRARARSSLRTPRVGSRELFYPSTAGSWPSCDHVVLGHFD